MMSETVVTIQGGPTNNANNPHQGPTLKSEPGQAVGPFQLNVPYFRTLPGIIKIVQAVVGIICMGCSGHAGAFYLFVAIAAFLFTLLWIFIYLFSVRESVKLPINWILTEMINTSLKAVFYLIAFIIAFAWAALSLNIAAGLFGLVNTLAYAAGVYFLYIEWKNSTQ